MIPTSTHACCWSTDLKRRIRKVRCFWVLDFGCWKLNAHHKTIMLFFLSFGLLDGSFGSHTVWAFSFQVLRWRLWEFGMQPYPFESKIRLENGRTRCWRNLEVWTHQEKKSQNRNGVCTHFDFPFFQKIKVSRNWVVTWTFFGKTSRPKIKES